VQSDEAEFLIAFGTVVGVALEHVVLRQRVRQLTHEVAQFAQTAAALANEALDAPVAPHRLRIRADFPPPNTTHERVTVSILEGLLTARERGILKLIAEGRSNREIAENPVLPHETVKSHVTRILRKLGAANRVDATSHYLQFVESVSRSSA
jgi:DNA-binding NarL/FixJ family response regulator